MKNILKIFTNKYTQYKLVSSLMYTLAFVAMSNKKNCVKGYSILPKFTGIT